MATVQEAQKALEEAQAGLELAFEKSLKADRKDMQAYLAASRELAAADAMVTKANKQVADAAFAEQGAERLSVNTAAKDALKAFVEGNPTFARAWELGTTMFALTPGSDGTVNVSANVKGGSGGDGKVRAPRAAGDGTGKGRHAITYNGTEYGSRAFLDAIIAEGGENGEYASKALDRYLNWKEPRWGPNGNEPMKAGPGFDAAVKALAGKLGATIS